MKKPIKTMEDFSAHVGLSRPTVSKYFNDPNSVRKKTRDIIEAALKQSGFRPNMFAVNLNRRRSNILAIIIPNPADPFYMALARRIEGIAVQAGYLAFVFNSDGKPEVEERAIETCKSMNVAGAIIAPLGTQSHRDKLLKLGNTIPLVYIDSPLDATSAFVGTDNRQSFQLIVEYLIRSGSAPCYFGLPPVSINAAERREAYGKAMEHAGLEPRYVAIEPTVNWDFETFAFDTTARLLREGSFPSNTVLCGNDRIAFGVIAATFQAGLKIGRGEGFDLRVAGHDDQPFSRYLCPPLTTVAQNYNEIGRLAIELLFEKLGDSHDPEFKPPANQRILLNAEIMLRMSA